MHPEKPAFKEEQGLYDILCSHGATESCLVLGGDSTASNTGHKGGVLTHLESMLGHKCQWNICAIHTNELPIRHLIQKLDGPTTSKDGFTGKIGKLLNKVEELEYNPSFLPIGVDEEDLIQLPESVLKNMSRDSQVCYKLCKAIKAGKLPEELRDIKLGEINHARWLTTQGRIIILCTKKHGLKGESLIILNILASYAVKSYFKLYFDIKFKHKKEDAPYHILTQLRILRTQPKLVKDIVTKYVRSGAWYAHAENVLLSLLASSIPSDRKFAVDKILKIPGNNEFGDSRLRQRLTPKINLDAEYLPDLIS